MRISDWSSDVCSSDLFTADQHSPDFVRTCANIEQFGVAQIALDRSILRISRTAQCLNSLQRHLDGIFAGQQDRARRAEASRFSSVATARDSVKKSDKRRVGQAGVSQCRYRWSPYH